MTEQTVCDRYRDAVIFLRRSGAYPWVSEIAIDGDLSVTLQTHERDQERALAFAHGVVEGFVFKAKVETPRGLLDGLTWADDWPEDRGRVTPQEIAREVVP